MAHAPPQAAVAALGTLHGKGAVIGPALAPCGLQVVEVAVDTDAFGTFTRAIPRAGTQRDAALAKARAALQVHPGAAYGLGSEGAFGPHPAAPFVPGGVELVVLVARDGSLVLEGIDVTFDVRHHAERVGSVDALDAALARVGLPEHAAVVAPAPEDEGVRGAPALSGARVGLRDVAEARAVAHALLASRGAAWIESDMRAHMNPTRMRAIGRAAAELARRWARRCPACGRPGFTVVERERGLSCRDCGAPTDLVQFERSACPCGYDETAAPPAPHAEPARCPECNP
jgi:hypothetical protein